MQFFISQGVNILAIKPCTGLEKNGSFRPLADAAKLSVIGREADVHLSWQRHPWKICRCRCCANRNWGNCNPTSDATDLMPIVSISETIRLIFIAYCDHPFPIRFPPTPVGHQRNGGRNFNIGELPCSLVEDSSRAQRRFSQPDRYRAGSTRSLQRLLFDLSRLPAFTE